jgi:SAM-dependent MidA family methyltransferase
VHLVKFTGGEWKERLVDWKEGDFEWTDAPVSSKKLREHLKKLPADPGENYTTEVNLDALEWMETLSSRLAAGYVLIADYGHPRAVYYESGRNAGTLACYSKHQRGDDPLQNAGMADITAHVEFTSLAESAQAHGLRVTGYADQHHFMVGLGKEVFPDTGEAPDAGRQKLLRAFSTLMHPNFMGMHFKFLALEKNIPPGSNAPLAGFQFSAGPEATLGLM